MYTFWFKLFKRLNKQLDFGSVESRDWALAGSAQAYWNISSVVGSIIQQYWNFKMEAISKLDGKA